MTADTELNSLHRGLRALEHLATRGPATISALGRALALPRANVYRIVRTLETDGYCLRIPNSALYIATDKLSCMGARMSEKDRLINAALPFFATARDRIQWPIGLVVPMGLNMLICLATDKENSLAISKFSPGGATPLLKTTSGILTLAFQEDAQRAATIERLVTAGQVDQFFFGDMAMLNRVLHKARANRYVLNDSRYTEGSVSTPIMAGDRLVGCMMTKYIRAAINRERVIAEILPILSESADHIAAAFAGPSAAIP